MNNEPAASQGPALRAAQLAAERSAQLAAQRAVRSPAPISKFEQNFVKPFRIFAQYSVKYHSIFQRFFSQKLTSWVNIVILLLSACVRSRA